MGEWSCTVCGRFENNSVRCTGCSGWVHKRCIDVKGSLARVEDIFVSKVCERADDGEDNVVHENMDLGNGVHLENVGKFCYLGDMLNGGGGADFASVAKVRCAWRKFKEMSGILTRKKLSLKLEENVHVTCVRSEKVYGSDTWTMNVEQCKIGADRDEYRTMDVWCISEE